MYAVSPVSLRYRSIRGVPSESDLTRARCASWFAPGIWMRRADAAATSTSAAMPARLRRLSARVVTAAKLTCAPNDAADDAADPLRQPGVVAGGRLRRGGLGRAPAPCATPGPRGQGRGPD